MNYPHKLLMLTMIIFFPLLQAQTQNEEELPTLELLEFLGEWENSEGEWIDPEKMEDEDFVNLLRLTAEEDE
jgi:hypothetical protein